MHRLFRYALAPFALGLAMMGCNRSGSSGDSEGRADQALADAPYRAAFRVPGMS